MEEKSVLLEALGDNPKLRVIDFLIDNMPFDYSKKEIIEGAEIGKVTFFKVWKSLVKFGIVKPTRKYGKAQLFKIDKENEIVKQLLRLEFILGRQAMKKAVAKEIKVKA